MWRKGNRDNRDDRDLRPGDGTAERFPVPIGDAEDHGQVQDRVQDSVQDRVHDGTGNVVPLRSRSVDDRDPATGTADATGTDTGPAGSGVRVEQVPWDGTGEVVEGVLVDLPPGAVPGMYPWERELARQDAVPLWVRDKDTRAAAVRWARSLVWHRVKFHAVRLPFYAGKLAVRVPRGLARVTADLGRWVNDAESLPLRLDAVRRGDASEYVRLSSRSEERRKLRGIVVATCAAVAGTGAAVVLFAAPGPLTVLAVAGAVAWLGARGGAADAPLIGRAVTTEEVPVLTSNMVILALGALGIAQINAALKRERGITFPAPITRDGPGFRCDVDLPLGVTATDIMERRAALASALRRPLGCVWPEQDPHHHEGRLVLWVGDRDMAKAPPAAWPLARTGKSNLFEPIPFGTDQRGRVVFLLLMFANMLIGAMPRYGKTFALRIVLLAAALDPNVALYVYELKGTGDLEALEQVAHRYASGPADDVTLAATMAGLREIFSELERRAYAIKKLPKDLCPENKVTPDIAARRSLGLFPIVVAIDECQEIFSSKEYGAEAEELCLAIIKRGPALGIMLVLATQRPDKDSLPTGVSANAGIRYCLRVMGQTENDMVLGTSSYKNGLRATEFTTKDKGIGILRGHADTHQIVRGYYVDGPGAEVICKRARALREAAGTITGHAAGDNPEITAQAGFSLLDDIAAVMAGDDKIWSETVCARLAELRPDTYRGWDATQLAGALKPYGLVTGQTWAADAAGKGANRRGFTRADLDAALQRIDKTKEGRG